MDRAGSQIFQMDFDSQIIERDLDGSPKISMGLEGSRSIAIQLDGSRWISIDLDGQSSRELDGSSS